MTELFGLEPPPVTDLRDLLEHDCSSVAQPPFGLHNETLWNSGGTDSRDTWRQLLQIERSTAQTTLTVSRDLTFREVPLEGSTVGGSDGGLALPPAPPDFCRVDGRSAPVFGLSAARTAGADGGDNGGGSGGDDGADAPDDGSGDRDAWLTVAPGLSGGLENLPPPVGPAGDPGPTADDLLTPLTFGDVTESAAEPPEDRGQTPPTADDGTIDQLLQSSEPYWPVLDTSGSGPAGQPTTSSGDGWARRADPAETLPDGVPDPEVMTFRFELDPFQKQAVALIERGENILVTAHTSAGKTAIAEYAIARALKDNDRVIYTSPVKALSNQKYGELRGQFGQVGLLTGDTQLHPEAACLICTTEILRSMLYNRPWLTEGLRTVVLDEVHYMGDHDRGHIWEECLILLPPGVNLVMLSATVPNAMDIAAWVGGIKRRPVYVVTCDRRPVPLEHVLYTGPAEDLWDDQLRPQRTFTVLDHNGVFSDDSYQLAHSVRHRRQRLDRSRSVASLPPDVPAAAAAPAQTNRRRHFTERQPSRRPERQTSRRERRPSRPDRQRGGGGSGGGHATPRRHSIAPPNMEQWTDLVHHMESSKLLPAIVFVFSRRRCDETAAALRQMDLTDEREKQLIRRRLRDLEEHLSPTDRALGTVCEMKDCLLRGLGVHHAGMLPFLKETVEMLFQAGLVKVLFATETFAIGINMPTRTVVFESLNKWDGALERRTLLPTEYIQMSGRAGRRGKDESGTVIIMATPHFPDKTDLQTVISTRPGPIVSQFRLTFFMLLNMLSAGRDAADVVWNSLALWGRQTSRELQDKLDSLQQQHEAARLSADEAELVHNQCDELVKLTREHREFRSGKLAERGNPSQGQVVLIDSETISRRLGVVIKSSQVDRDAWRRARHTVLVLKEPPDHTSNPSPTPECPPEPADHTLDPSPTPLPTGGGVSAAARDGDLARRAAAALRPPLLRAAAGGGSAPAHQLVTVGWGDLEAVMDAHVTAPPSVADNIRQREMPRFANTEPSAACAAAVRRLSDLSEASPAGCQPVRSVPEPPRVQELRLSLQRRYPGTETAQLVRQLEVAFSVGRLYGELSQLGHWSDETAAMVRVLRQLGFVDSGGRVTGKGRAACGVGYRQLLVTELVCDPSTGLRDLTPAQLAALLSAVSHAVPLSAAQTRQEPETKGLPTPLAKGVRRLVAVARRIDDVQRAAGLVSGTEEEHSLLFDLVPAVLGWAQGEDLSELRLPDHSQQGSLCRSLQRLDETLRDVRDLAVTLKFPKLQALVRDALVAIRRGLPFNPSIYTVDIGGYQR